MDNILKPRGDQNFPYWPAPRIQIAQSIPGQQLAGKIADINLNKSMYMLGYAKGDIQKLAAPEALQDKRGATQFLESTPAMGRGAGVGLTDMLIMSVAQTQAQGVTK